MKEEISDLNGRSLEMIHLKDRTKVYKKWRNSELSEKEILDTVPEGERRGQSLFKEIIRELPNPGEGIGHTGPWR